MSGPGNSSTVLGWREWVAMPELDVPWIKAKVDTGARSCAIHAFDIEELQGGPIPLVRFTIHPWQRATDDAVTVIRPILDRRTVRSSSGHTEERITVETDVRILGRTIPVALTLAARDQMGFRLLIGREALGQGFLVDPSHSYLGGRPHRAVRRKNWGHDATRA